MRKTAYLFCLLSIFFIGCKQSSSLKTAPVSGQVTLDNQPVEGVTVTFLPKAGADGGYSATGFTNAEGRYELQTFESATKPVTGAVPGEYDVIIVKPQTTQALSDPTKGNAAQGGMSPEQMRAMSGGIDPSKQGKAMPGSGPAKSTLPAKYASRKDSGLSATVSTGQNPPIDFKLTQ